MVTLHRLTIPLAGAVFLFGIGCNLESKKSDPTHFEASQFATNPSTKQSVNERRHGTFPQPIDPRSKNRAEEHWTKGAKQNGATPQGARERTADHANGNGAVQPEEGKTRARRELWIERMHRAPDGISWKAIEKKNQTTEHKRRLHLSLLQKRAPAKSQAHYSGLSSNPLQSGDNSKHKTNHQTRGQEPLPFQTSGSGAPPSIAPHTVGAAGTAGQAQGEIQIPARGYWEEVGSRNQAGHTRCAAVGQSTNGPLPLYVGSAGGGVWQSPDSGTTWQPMSDMLFGGADEIIALPAGPNQTVDRLVFRRGSDVYFSEDGGQIWQASSGFPPLAEFRTLQQFHDGQGTLLALVRTKNGALPVETWLYRSQDFGVSFQPLWQAPESGRGDLWTPQSGPRSGLDIFLSLAGKVYRSENQGSTFTSGGAWIANATESHITGSEDGGITLYVVFRKSGQWLLWKSFDAGVVSIPVGPLVDYWGNPRSMVGFSTNQSALVYGGVNAYQSLDGGITFAPINQWSEYYTDPDGKLHADIRGLDVYRSRGNSGFEDHLYFNTDGGTYLSTDFGNTVQNLCTAGLGVGQFYSTLSASDDPSYISGGTQDQGFQVGARGPYFAPGPSSDLRQFVSGDYGHLVSGDGTHGLVYGVYPGATSDSVPGFVLVQEASGDPLDPTFTSVPFPPASDSLWMPPIVADPLDVESFYFLGDTLWKGTRAIGSWNFSQHSTQLFSDTENAFLSAMAIAPSDPQRMLAASDGGALWWSVDGGATWNPASDPGPGAHYFYGSKLLIDPLDPMMALACGSGYGSAGVRVSYDGGDHWQPFGQNQPTTLFYDLAWSPNQNGDVYAATEAGAYRYIAATDRWENLMGLEAPSTVYWSVESIPSEHRVRFGTYGRGIWDFVLLAPLRNIGDVFCKSAVPNSTFHAGQLTVTGTPLAEARTISLQASQLPPDEFGYFLLSDGRSNPFIPMWSDGFLCLDSNRQTFGFQATGTAGSMTHTLELSQLPMSPSQSVVAGQTWYFQGWHSDFVFVNTGNFTDAVGVYFH